MPPASSAGPICLQHPQQAPYASSILSRPHMPPASSAGPTCLQQAGLRRLCIGKQRLCISPQKAPEGCALASKAVDRSASPRRPQKAVHPAKLWIVQQAPEGPRRLCIGQQSCGSFSKPQKAPEGCASASRSPQKAPEGCASASKAVHRSAPEGPRRLWIVQQAPEGPRRLWIGQQSCASASKPQKAPEGCGSFSKPQKAPEGCASASKAVHRPVSPRRPQKLWVIQLDPRRL